MANRKRQHYVPNFYLKYFSSREGSILMYNLDRKICIEVPIKGQCSQDYFYSTEEDIEDAFSKLEEKASLILKKIINHKKLTYIDETEYVTLISFILLQRGRTKYSNDKQVEVLDYAFENFIKPMALANKKIQEAGLTKKDFDDLRLTHSNPVLLPLMGHMGSGPLISDLQVALVINASNLDFITSDTPVIFFNSFFNGKVDMGVDGFQSRGLQIFYPISSRLLLMLFDPQYYIAKLKDGQIIKATKNKDIRRINGLHVLNCDRNIYFQNSKMCTVVEQQRNELGFKRPAKKAKFDVYVPIDNNSPRGELHRLSSSKYTYNLDLSFLNISKSANPKPGIRIPILVKFHRKLMDKINKDKISSKKDFDKIIEEISKDIDNA